MFVQPWKCLTVSFSLILAASLFTARPTVYGEETQTAIPKLGLAFTELPPTVKELRFVFECEDGLEIEMRWIAQNVGNVAPPNYELGRLKMVTRGPLNVAAYSRPTNGWPLGLYRLELRHNEKLFHTQYYVIEDLESLNGE